jgi:Histidine kinase-, DNA gyrase B-, and HSP90-like ATPase
MTTTTNSSFEAANADQPVAHWGQNAPKGGRTVLTRSVKEGASVPLFIGQTVINALRDLGYNDTTSAICEHVDNAIQWGATEVRVYFHEVGRQNQDKRIDVLVYDNGTGMAPNVLKTVTAFGGSMSFDNRDGIGRYGMGMKAAALSISPVLDIYSWQERGAIYSMTLDVNEIANDQKNLVQLPDPQLCDSLPVDVREILASPMTYPKKPAETQHLFSSDEELSERLGQSGTIVVMPRADRLTYRQAKSLVDHATKHMARIYRRHLARGLRLFVNNRRVDPFDPNYFMEQARHASILSAHSESEGVKELKSRLINTYEIDVPEEENGTKTHKVTARIFMLPIDDWHALPRKVLRNDLHVFDTGVSFMRSDREVQYAPMATLTGKTSRDPWWRLEIEFPATLDEAFGIAVNKQGVRPKNYVIDAIDKVVREEIASVRRRVEKFQSERSTEERRGHLTDAEQRANEADAFQSNVLAQPVGATEDEKRELEARLRELAISYKRSDENEEEAVERFRKSRFVTTYRHDEGPFYGVEFQLGRVILAINTAHPFFEHIYEPIRKMGKLSEGNGDEGAAIEPELAAKCAKLATNMELLLLALARTQSEMVTADPDSRRTFDRVRKRWSDTLDTMVTTS